uniref:Peptidase S1 domain-containing protein n=1 Tax=Anopheles farauti TaxID=69004 RepID=A0A182QJZ0_9DIPT
MALEYDVLELIVHPECSLHNIRNDIALIKLANEITYTDFIQPICLWNRDDDHSAIMHKVGAVVGFGYDGICLLSERIH